MNSVEMYLILQIPFIKPQTRAEEELIPAPEGRVELILHVKLTIWDFSY